MAFSREQGNAVPVIVKQIAAINRRKPDYSGYFGTPEGIRTPDTRLRRAVLCPAELLARIQFLFVSVTPAVENPPNVRRRTLYPGEVRGRVEEIFSFAASADRGLPDVRRRTLYPGEVRGHSIMRCSLRTGIYSFYTGTHNIISLLHQLGNVNKITCQEHVKMRKVCFGTRKGLHGGVENAMIKLRKMG